MYHTLKKEVKLLFFTLFLFFSTLGVTVCYGASLIQTGDTTQITQLHQLANSFLNTDNDQAEALSKKALRLSKELHFDKGEVISLKLLAHIYDQKKQFDKAALFYELYTSKKDSIQKKGSERSVALLNAKFDYTVREAKIEKEQALKQKELENLIEQKQLSQSRLMIVFIFIAASLMIIICYVFLIKNRNNALRKQQYEIEQITLKQSEIIERKTSELLSSNDAISHYAFLNSHELRAPLAKILSIVYLFDQMNITEAAFSKLLKKSAKELEKAVKKIIHELPKDARNDNVSNERPK